MGHMTTQARTYEYADFVKRFGPADVINRFLFEDRLDDVIRRESANLRQDLDDAQNNYDEADIALDNMTDSYNDLKDVLAKAVTEGLLTQEWVDAATA